MSSLVSVNLLVPQDLKDRMIALAANNPDQYYSTTQAWIKAARSYLGKNELTPEQLEMRRLYNLRKKKVINDE